MYSSLSRDAKTDLPLSRERREKITWFQRPMRAARRHEGGVLCRFFTEAEKISVDIFNIEVLATPWSLFEWSNDMGSLRLQFIE